MKRIWTFFLNYAIQLFHLLGLSSLKKDSGMRWTALVGALLINGGTQQADRSIL